MPERKIDDVDLQARAVQRGELNGVDDVARQAHAVGVQYLQAHDPRLRRDAAVDANVDLADVAVAVDRSSLSLRTFSRAANQAGDMRPVPVVVVGMDLLGKPGEHVLLVVLAAVQIRSFFHAGVDDRNADVFSRRSIVIDGIEAERFQQAARTCEACGIVRRVRRDDRVGGHVRDVRVGFERIEIFGVNRR